MRNQVVVQVTERPFGITERIPDSAWHAYGKAATVRGLCRVYANAWGYTHPEQNAYCGNLRLTVNGERVSALQSVLHLGGTDGEHLELSLAGKLPR